MRYVIDDIFPFFPVVRRACETLSSREKIMARSLRRFLPILLVATLLAAGIQPGPTAAQDESIELRIWDQFTDEAGNAAAEAIYAAFMEQNPNVTIVREAIALDKMRQTANTALASGTGPDIIFYDAGPGYAGVLANAGLLLPLDTYAEQYGWNDRIATQSLEATSLDNQLYGLPLLVDLIGLYYNKTIFDQEGWAAPQTVEELKTVCQQANDAGYAPPFAFSNNPGWQAYHPFSMTTNAMIGPDAMRALLYDHQGSWNTPEIVTAIRTFFVDLKDAGCFTEDANAFTYDDGNSLFYSGQSVMHPTGSWLVNEIDPAMPEQEIAFIPFPQIDGAQGQYWVSGVGSAFYISAQSQHPDAAAQLLDFMFSPEMVTQWIEVGGFYVPVLVEDTASLDVSPLYRSVLDVIQSGIGANAQTQFGYNVDVLAPPEFNEILLNGLQALVSGDSSPEQLAADLQASWEASFPAGSAEATPGA
jgi:raffinose/stachyose/melibiose transport system substrate-binding protein